MSVLSIPSIKRQNWCPYSWIWAGPWMFQPKKCKSFTMKLWVQTLRWGSNTSTLSEPGSHITKKPKQPCRKIHIEEKWKKKEEKWSPVTDMINNLKDLQHRLCFQALNIIQWKPSFLKFDNTSNSLSILCSQ